ncbi:MAG TPA: hypothetical protein VLC09_00525, partial [Polyangiaceae bacterium]|nr:hypothetical protein [Polyangiaceae bacterium]
AESCPGNGIECRDVGDKPQCLECVPGEKRCNGTISMECTEKGTWESRECRADGTDYCYEAKCVTEETVVTLCEKGYQPSGCLKSQAYAWMCRERKFHVEDCANQKQVCVGESGRCTDPVE